MKRKTECLNDSHRQVAEARSTNVARKAGLVNKPRLSRPAPTDPQDLAPHPHPGLPPVGELHPTGLKDVLQVTQRRSLGLLPFVLEAGDRRGRELGLLGELSDGPVKQTAGSTAERRGKHRRHEPRMHESVIGRDFPPQTSTASSLCASSST